MIKQTIMATMAATVLAGCTISYTPAHVIAEEKRIAREARIAKQQQIAEEARISLQNSIIKSCKENLELTPYKDVKSCVDGKNNEIKLKREAAIAKQQAAKRYHKSNKRSSGDIIKERALQRGVDKLFGR